METDNTLEEKPIIVPTKEHTYLENFIGKWAVEGENHDNSPNHPNTLVKGVETYEWLPGGFFLVYKWDRYFGSENHIGIGIISHDDTNHNFEINNYDNLGYCRTYQIVYTDNSWKFDGPNERATITFAMDGNSFTEHWEKRDEQGSWQPLCKLKAARIS